MSNPTIIHDTFLSFYSDLLCKPTENRKKINMRVVHSGLVLSTEHKDILNLRFSLEEIKGALWSIPKDKAPGLDGYNRKFYKAAWSVVGDDFVEAVQTFFNLWEALKAIELYGYHVGSHGV